MRSVTATLAVATIAAALPAAAHAGRVHTKLDGNTLEVDCDKSCHVLVEAVGSRVHIFDLTGTWKDQRTDNGYRAQHCRQHDADNVPNRNWSYAQADVDWIDLKGSGGNDYFDLRGLSAFATVDTKGGEDHVVSELDGSYRLGGGDDCGLLLAGGDLYGQSGMDELTVQGGPAYVDGGDDADEIETDDWDDVVRGGSGPDIIFGEGGDDELRGNHGNDDIQDMHGSNALFGGRDDDWLKTNGSSSIDGRAGTDTCVGQSGTQMTSCER